MYEDVDMYGVPYQDHDPLMGLVVTIALIIIYHVVQYVRQLLKD
jgi:hypothetical protein